MSWQKAREHIGDSGKHLEGRRLNLHDAWLERRVEPEYDGSNLRGRVRAHEDDPMMPVGAPDDDCQYMCGMFCVVGESDQSSARESAKGGIDCFAHMSPSSESKE